MATALILGANGFVGPWLAKELSTHGYRVCGSDVQQNPSERLQCDLYQTANLLDAESLKQLVEKVRPDQVYNLAAVSSVGQSWRNPALTIRVNVEGVVNLLETCRAMDHIPKVLLVGSSEEYAPSTEPLSEGSPIAANNPYGISKEAQGRLADMYCREYGLPIYRVRAFNHTGPGQPSTFVLPSWCSQVARIEKSGATGVIKVGNLNVSRDFTDVRDVVRAYRLLMESEHVGKIFNVGSGVSRPLREFLDVIISYSTQEVIVSVSDGLLRPTDNPYICGDTRQIQDALGWSAKRDIAETLFVMYTSMLQSEN